MKRIWIEFIALLLCVYAFGQDATSDDESFETLKAKAVEFSKGKFPESYLYDQRKLFSKPFKKCIESDNPFEKDSFIYKIFYDPQTNLAAMGMMDEYIYWGISLTKVPPTACVFHACYAGLLRWNGTLPVGFAQSSR